MSAEVSAAQFFRPNFLPARTGIYAAARSTRYPNGLLIAASLGYTGVIYLPGVYVQSDQRASSQHRILSVHTAVRRTPYIANELLV